MGERSRTDRRSSSRSPRRRRSRSRSRSERRSASLKRSHHRHRDGHSHNHRAEGAEKKKLENREEVAHRSRMWTVVDSDDDSTKTEEKKRNRSPDRRHSHRHRHSRRRSRSRSSSRSESSSESDSDSSDSSEDERSRRKRKSKHRSSHKEKKRHKKDKKRKKHSRSSSKHAVNQDQYGKYGILRESDFHNKSVSFQAWIRDVKKMGEFNGPKWEAMELFKEYMEDYNTCTLPHEKYYDIEKYEMKRYQKQQRKALAKHKGKSDKAQTALADEERVRLDRQAAREKKEQDEFRLVLKLMDKDKIEAMREQERLRSQMQLFYKSGNVEEARRLEQILNKVDEDSRFQR
ncbi:hypothetical protein P3T76_013873 [Phytophthora citrophthora]|uniref:Uncharacterized protein n=1 Tax=Phytophthora citrophthora TaxID=4793 RepID=A0AAD9G2H8_9STRA|nr:hypothetical protein P3T76_013873 [Phytophthora citrophthora]